jgi:WD40 repeat protein
MTLSTRLLGLALTLFLFACGGGNGGNSPPPPAPPPPPAAPSGLGYPAAPTLSVNTAMTALTPTVIGTVTAWSVNPALPAGLAINATTGAITGTPTAITPSASYTITATNASGSTTFALTISVNKVLLELGLSAAPYALKMSGQRILSADGTLRVVLWNSQSGAQLYSVAPDCQQCLPDIQLAGPTAAIKTHTGITLRASADGSALGSIALTNGNDFWWTLATDGSYVVAGSVNGLTAWSPAGAVLFTRTGNYNAAKVFAAPSQLRIADGPAGPAVIENLAMPGGAQSTTPAFVGTFGKWFEDGNRFLTTVGNTVRVYSNASALLDFTSVSGLQIGGFGNFFWAGTSTVLDIYEVGASAIPAATYTSAVNGTLHPSAGLLGVTVPTGTGFRIVDLNGAAPASTTYNAPRGPVQEFAAASASDWVIAASAGVIYGEIPAVGTPQRYSLGSVLAFSGNANRLALATASGSIRLYDAATLTQTAEIDFPANKLMLSDDDAVLFAESQTVDIGSAERTVRFYGLPAQNVIAQRNYTYTTPGVGFETTTMSRSGTIVGELRFESPGSPNTYRRTISDLAGSVLHTDTFTPNQLVLDIAASDSLHIAPLNPALSPDGSQNFAIGTPINSDSSTLIRNGSTVVGSVPGIAIGWYDNARLVVLRFQPNTDSAVFLRVEVVNTAGQILGSWTPARPFLEFVPLTNDRIYIPSSNSIRNLSTGAVIWTGSAPAGFGVAGSTVVFGSGTQVVAEAF